MSGDVTDSDNTTNTTGEVSVPEERLIDGKPLTRKIPNKEEITAKVRDLVKDSLERLKDK